jgi:AsmA protein
MQDEQDRRDRDAFAAERDRNANLDAELEAAAALQIDPEDLQPKPWVLPDRRRVLTVVAILVTLALLVILPPLISVNRFRHRISQSVSESLGRPVRIDSVTLNLLPMPGFTLENFVVGDDPAFSSEPVIRAQTVKVTLRVWSLWRRRVEFSRISLDDPSVNLVHRADGRWNIESLLLQASKIEAAPTAQQGAGTEPRFPYIEATGARVNVKMGLEKMPIALTETDLALWLTQPDQWKFRLEGHPTRTNTAATDTGLLRVQGTLGKASTLADAPIDTTLEWRAAPMGGVSWVLLARDAGFRGTLAVRTTIQGTVGKNKVDTELDLNDVRRSDFVPQHTLNANIRCTAQAAAVFHQLTDVRCGWPSGALTDTSVKGFTLAGGVADLSRWRSAAGDAAIAGVPASSLLDAVRLASPRISPDLTAGGAISGTLACCAKGDAWAAINGQLAIEKATLALGKNKPIAAEDVAGDLAGGQLTIHPVALDLGAPQPAVLDGRIDANGFALHLAGSAMRTQLMQLAAALPPFGDGLDGALPPAPQSGAPETPIRLDLTSSRTWFTGQTWTATETKPVKRRHGSR